MISANEGVRGAHWPGPLKDGPVRALAAEFRGGCTLLIDLATAEVRYLLRKKVKSADRLASQMSFAADAGDGLRANYFSGEGSRAEPFALMHRVHG
jgi:hypothetical protein